MRTKIFLKHLILGAMLLTTGKVVSQVTTSSNVAAGPTDFLGWNNTFPANNFPLRVRHDLNQPIEWYTDALNRMRLTGTLTNQNWAWYQNNNLDFSGHLGIGNPTPQTPLTYLHINSSALTSITVGYRPWMRVGVFTTQGTDGMYAGMRLWNNRTHSIINWSDDDNAANQMDPLSFVFTSTPDNSSTASTLGGLEVARIAPATNGNEGYLGVGDFFSAGAVPGERLDILDGRLRIRQLPDDAEADAEFKVMVVDDTNDPDERGVVKWRSINLNAGCDWVVQDQPPFTEPHVSSTYDNSNCAWDRRHGVGIGVQIPKTKLHVQHTDNSLLSPTAIMADARFDLGNGGQLFGLYSQARPSSSTTAIQNQQATGAFGQAINSRSSVGVHGFGSTCTASEGTASEVIGVRGVATGCERAAFVAGLYGEGSGAQNANNEWAAYVNGRG